MKFGKRLRDLLEDSLPEYRNKFLDYKELKKRLKSLAPEETGATTAPNGQSTAVEAAGAENDDGAPDAAPRERSEEEVRSEEEFVNLLNDELEKFNGFFMEKEEEFVIRMQVLREEIKKMEVQCPDGDLTNCNGCEDHVNGVRKMIVSLHGEMVLLENYSALNYTGLVKILKKHDKRTGLLLRHPFISNVLRQPFLTTEILSRLIKECEERMQVIFPAHSAAGSQVSGAAAECCIEEDTPQRDSSPEPQDTGGPEASQHSTLEVEHHVDVQAVYRNALTALRSLQEIRGSSKTPHPLLAEANTLAGIPVAYQPGAHGAESGAEAASRVGQESLVKMSCSATSAVRCNGKAAGSEVPAKGLGQGEEGDGHAVTSPECAKRRAVDGNPCEGSRNSAEEGASKEGRQPACDAGCGAVALSDQVEDQAGEKQ